MKVEEEVKKVEEAKKVLVLVVKGGLVKFVSVVRGGGVVGRGVFVFRGVFVVRGRGAVIILVRGLFIMCIYLYIYM